MDAVLAISVVLAVMFASIYLRASLSLTLLTGILLTSLFFERLDGIPSDLVATLTDFDTINLMVLVYSVFFLTGFLTKTGALSRMVESIEHMVSDRRVIIASVPALVGLMPVLSGAVISAPFADKMGDDFQLSREKKHVLNYWFRHISEYINPIYPGTLLATIMVGIPFYVFFLANLPVMLAYTVLGVFFLIIPLGKPKKIRKNGSANVRDFFLGVAPIVSAVIIPLVFRVELWVAMLSAVILALIINHKSIGMFNKTARESVKFDLLALVYLVMLFKTVLDDTHAAERISSELLVKGVPAELLLMVIPWIAGFLTGMTLGFVGISFPLLMPLLVINGTPSMQNVVLAYVSGYIGILLSPMHLCFTVTQKYFNADIRKSYKMILPPVAILFVLTYAYVKLAL